MNSPATTRVPDPQTPSPLAGAAAGANAPFSAAALKVARSSLLDPAGLDDGLLGSALDLVPVSYTHLTLPTIYSV